MKKGFEKNIKYSHSIDENIKILEEYYLMNNIAIDVLIEKEEYEHCAILRDENIQIRWKIEQLKEIIKDNELPF